MIVATMATVRSVGEVKRLPSGFRVCEWVVVTEEAEPQTLKVRFCGENADKPGALDVGDRVNISFAICGREWQNPGTFRIQVFNTLDGVSIRRDGAAPDADSQKHEDYDYE